MPRINPVIGNKYLAGLTKFPKKLPEIVIYNSNDIYKMSSIKTGETLGIMKALKVRTPKSSFHPHMTYCDTFSINEIRVKNDDLKLGKKFVNVAKAESHHQGCQGRVGMISYNTQDPNNPKHIFHKKLGFKATDERVQKHLEFCEEFKVPIYFQFNYISMYL